MKKVTFLLSIVGIILTFVGAGYVIYNHGSVNAGCACIPMLFTLVCIAFHRQQSEKEKKSTTKDRQ